jgi:ribosomal protein S18 acetylase RimI-like enzyme
MKDGEMTFWTTRPNFMLVIVDQDSSKILGLVSMQKKSEDTAELNRLSVRSDTRGQGIGRKLVEGFIEEARKRGFKKVYLETADAQKPAIRLYERVGFKNIGTDGIAHVIGPYIPSCFHGVYVVKLILHV